MNKEQMAILNNRVKTGRYISANEIINTIGRVETTLLYGYTIDRNTFHIYLKNGLIHKIIYNDVIDYMQRHRSDVRFIADQLVPSKRVYPGRTLFTFAKMLIDITGEQIPFTVWEHNLDEKDYVKEGNFYIAGKTCEDFQK